MRGFNLTSRVEGALPLVWAGATQVQDYLNFGDALSAITVAALSGQRIERRPFKSKSVRMTAVGTIMHGVEGGTVHVWGSGSSNMLHPGTSKQVPYEFPRDTDMYIHATRGPISAAILAGGCFINKEVYGDPVWLLKDYYKPLNRGPKYELGVILHLSELADRAMTANPRKEMLRFAVPPSMERDIKLITTAAPISSDGVKAKIDEILDCRRIVSTSLHGMVIAEMYNIPCLYFNPRSAGGLKSYAFDINSTDLDLRILDLYSGVGIKQRFVYDQPRNIATDWDVLLGSIDRCWEPLSLSTQDLKYSFPADLCTTQTENVFEENYVKDLKLQHDVKTLLSEDARRHKTE